MENYEYLIELFKNTETGLYDFFISTYNGNDISINTFICDRRHDMRMDLVSNDIYNTNKYVGTLCQLNNIMNPYSIKNGDVLIYPTKTEADALLIVADVIKNPGVAAAVSAVKSDLINVLKKRQKDLNKGNFDRNRPNEDILPPTVPSSNAPDIVFENNLIKISPGLYKNPNNTINTVPTVPSLVPKINTSQPNTTQRVLVNRFIVQR